MGGKVTCTLGEVKQRADFIVYWGGNPAECHPRHFTKYTIMQKSKFLPRGRKDRTMVLVDIRETKSAKAADIFLQMVQQGYPPVYRHKSFEFGEARADGGRIAQRVHIVDDNGEAWEALYTLEQQADGSLKITGCSLLKAGQAV